MQRDAAQTRARRIGKYEVLGELGQGGMAVVYRARHPQLQRDVAVKVLHPHLAGDPESRARFRREAMAAARLKHPNIVEVYDFADEDDRESFMVTELLEGPTLRRFAEQHPGMPAEVVAVIGMVLCDALECAHGQGVVHRDVKPDNILLQKGGVLKLTDFGIAHVADAYGMTVTGQVLGSPAHMAPEQIEGRHVDARADIFALGTVLYVLAVGRLPFDANNPHALLRKVLEADYPDPLRSAPAIGHRFAAIICRCLERDPDHRYPSASALREALRAFTAEAGWTDPAAQLARYLEAPEAFVDEHRVRLLQRLPELGAAARKAGSIPDALGYFNRALALDPTNPKVLAMVRGISRRRRMRRALGSVGIVVVAASVSGLGVVGVARHLRATQVASEVVSRPSTPAGQDPGQLLVRREVVQNAQPRTISTLATYERPPVQQPSAAQTVRTSLSHTTDSSQRSTATSRQQVRPAQSLERAMTGPSNAQASSVPTRHVRVWLYPPGNYLYSVDSSEPIPYNSLRADFDLPIGEHRIALVPVDHSCEARTVTRIVQPGPGTQTLTIPTACNRLPAATTSAADGGHAVVAVP